MLQHLHSFCTATSDGQLKAAEKAMDDMFLANPEQATAEALSVIAPPSSSPDPTSSSASSSSNNNNNNNNAPPPQARLVAASVLFRFVDQRWRVPSGDGGNSHTRQMKINIRNMIMDVASTTARRQQHNNNNHNNNEVVFHIISDKATLRKFANTVARITRFDFPAQWPDGGPFERLLAALASLTSNGEAPSWQRHQVLFVLHLILKELVSQRNARAQQAIQEAVKRTLALCGPLTGEIVAFLTNGASANGAVIGVPEADNPVVTELKTLSKIILRCAAALQLDLPSVKASIDAAEAFASQVVDNNDGENNNNNSSSSNAAKRDNVIMLTERFFKIVCWAAEKHAINIQSEEVIGRMSSFLIKGLRQTFSEKIHARSANALKDLLDICASTSSSSKVGLRIRNALTQVLNPQTVNELMRDLVARFFRDTVDDLREWDEDPEQFVIDRDVGSASSMVDDDASAAQASEQFFLSLASSGWPGVVDLIWSVLTEALSSNDPSFIAAALHAIGLGYSSLGTPEQFNQFLHEKLLPTLANALAASSSSSSSSSSNNNDNNKPSPLVLRRIVWVIGMWCDSITDSQVRRNVFEGLAQLLSAQTHPVIVLTALRSISHLCTDGSFRASDIIGRPLEATLNAVKAMLRQTRSPETTTNLVGLIFIASETVCSQMPQEALPIIKSVGAYGCVIDCLGGYVQRADEQEDSDSEQCSAARVILEALTSAFQHQLLDGAEATRALSLALACQDVDRVIHVWTDDSAWELIATFVGNGGRDVPHDAARSVFEASVKSMGRDFDGTSHAVLTMAYLTLFLAPDVFERIAKSCPRPPRGGGDAGSNNATTAERDDASNLFGGFPISVFRLLLDWSEDSGNPSLIHNSVLLLEALIRRFPNDPAWNCSDHVQKLFDAFGDSQVGIHSSSLAVACCLCFSQGVPPIPPQVCANFAEKTEEVCDFLPNLYAKLLVLRGLSSACQKVFGGGGNNNNNNNLQEQCQNILGELGESVNMITDDDVQSHWSSPLTTFLLNEKRNN